ncbi:MAG: hypothetical protein HW416_2963 [Chloroflexi bacterium]|nr:hypothetical protein [Chloroflexota bacterium]
MMSGPPSSWDDYAEKVRQQVPAAPEQLLAGYVQWAPWIAIVFGGIGLVFLLVFSLIGAVLMPFLALSGAQGISMGLTAILSLGLAIIASAIEVGGGYLMLQRSLTGWWLIALGLAVSVLSNLIGFSLFGLVIALAIGYLHVQVKPRYS